jgi:N-acetylglucosaminyldiphosphoundecaprenol N-acetyl-beta-D-mannosaminyltransferase
MSRPEEFKNQTIILGVQIDDLSLDKVMAKVDDFLRSDKQARIFTPNPEICLKAAEDESYRQILNDAELCIPDGFGLKLGAKIFGEKLNNRVTGADLTKAILEKYKNDSFKMYIVLREDSLSQKSDLSKLFHEKYPNINIRGSLLNKDTYLNYDKLLNEIIDFAPQILFVCLGAPRQEIWIAKYLKTLTSVKIALGVGGTFDFLTGKIKRAPEILRKLGMEWFYRLYQEPKRLSRIKNATANFLLKCHEWNKRIRTEMRPNVLGIIRNSAGNYLVQKNAYFDNHWQFPQGGIAPKEKPEQAIIREASEELGIDPRFLRVVRKFSEQHEYVWPRYAQLLRGYRGQTQSAFLLEFTGTDQDIHLEKSHEVESVKWVGKADIIKTLHPIRRDFAQQLITSL